MEAVKQQVKQLYVLLSILYLIGMVTLVFWDRAGIVSFTFGTLISSLNIYLTYLSFKNVYRNSQDARSFLFSGPLPKLVLIILGSIICQQVPEMLPIVPFLAGVCLYAFSYLLAGAEDYFMSRKR